MRDFITAPEVAQILELDNAAAFLRVRHRLERDADFPQPLPIQHRPLKWRRDAIEAWKAVQGHASTADAPTPASWGPNVILMSEAARP